MRACSDVLQRSTISSAVLSEIILTENGVGFKAINRVLKARETATDIIKRRDLARSRYRTPPQGSRNIQESLRIPRAELARCGIPNPWFTVVLDSSDSVSHGLGQVRPV